MRLCGVREIGLRTHERRCNYPCAVRLLNPRVIRRRMSFAKNTVLPVTWQIASVRLPRESDVFHRATQYVK